MYGTAQSPNESLIQTTIEILEELRQIFNCDFLEDIIPNVADLHYRVRQFDKIKNWIYEHTNVFNENYHKASNSIAAEGTRNSSDLALRLMCHSQLKKFKWTGYTHYYVCKTFDVRSLSSRAKEETIHELIKVDLVEGKVFFEPKQDFNQKRSLFWSKLTS